MSVERAVRPATCFDAVQVAYARHARQVYEMEHNALCVEKLAAYRAQWLASSAVFIRENSDILRYFNPWLLRHDLFDV